MNREHGTCVALHGIGVLLVGASGCGKSDLALRLIGRGAALVADDAVLLQLEQDVLLASAPPNLAGLLEVRGVGILRFPIAEVCRLGLIVDCKPIPEIERLPEPRFGFIMGQQLRRIEINPFEASAELKIIAAVEAITDPARWAA